MPPAAASEHLHDQLDRDHDILTEMCGTEIAACLNTPTPQLLSCYCSRSSLFWRASSGKHQTVCRHSAYVPSGMPSYSPGQGMRDSHLQAKASEVRPRHCRTPAAAGPGSPSASLPDSVRIHDYD